MMKKFMLLVSTLLTAYSGFATDSLTITRRTFIGPPVLVLPPPVDSALLIKNLVSERLKKKGIEQNDLKTRQTLVRLNNLLLQTEIIGSADSTSIKTLGESLSAYQRAGDLKNQALVYSTYGVYFGKSGQFEKSIYHFEEALQIKEKIGDKAAIVSLAENLANLYKLKDNKNEAIKYFGKAASANLSLQKTTPAGYDYLQLAVLKYQQGKFKESENYILKKAFPLFRRTGNKYGRMKSFQNLAELYFEQGRYTETKWFFLQSQLMAQKLLNNEAYIASLIGLGKARNAEGDYQDALRLYKQAEQLALSNNYLVNLVEISGSLGDVYTQLGNYPAAGIALDQYNKFKDSWLESTQL